MSDFNRFEFRKKAEQISNENKSFIEDYGRGGVTPDTLVSGEEYLFMCKDKGLEEVSLKDQCERIITLYYYNLMSVDEEIGELIQDLMKRTAFALNVKEPGDIHIPKAHVTINLNPKDKTNIAHKTASPKMPEEYDHDTFKLNAKRLHEQNKTFLEQFGSGDLTPDVLVSPAQYLYTCQEMGMDSKSMFHFYGLLVQSINVNGVDHDDNASLREEIIKRLNIAVDTSELSGRIITPNNYFTYMVDNRPKERTVSKTLSTSMSFTDQAKELDLKNKLFCDNYTHGTLDFDIMMTGKDYLIECLENDEDPVSLMDFVDEIKRITDHPTEMDTFSVFQEMIAHIKHLTGDNFEGTFLHIPSLGIEYDNRRPDQM